MKDIQLSDDDRSFVEDRIRTGPYRNANDVIHAGLRALQRDEVFLKHLIQEGEDDLAAGRFYEFEEEDDLTEFIIARSNARRG